jgi:hypothetical protein
MFHFNFSWFNVYSMTVSHLCGSVYDQICSTAPEFALRNYGKITKKIRQSELEFLFETDILEIISFTDWANLLSLI